MTDFFGTQGNDTITGTAGDDVILSGTGSDTVDGGDGDDVIIAGDYYASTGWSSLFGFNVLLRGGAGNDRITAIFASSGSTNFGDQFQNITVEGGDGNDHVTAALYSYGILTVNLGAGDDVLNISGAATVTLGAGRDRVVIGDDFLSQTLGRPNITISDFAAGNTGDVLDVGAIVADYFDFPNALNGTISANPFASGHLRLVQDGADVLVRLDVDGNASGVGAAYERDIVRLTGVTVAQLTAANFGGWAPSGSAPVSASISGTASNDVLDAGPVGSTVLGLGGNDDIRGGRLADRLEGGDGNDTLNGGGGGDTLLGGNGNDIIRDGRGSDTIDAGDGDDVIDLVRAVWNRNDVNFAPEVLTVAAGAGNDVVNLGRSARQNSSDYIAPMTATVDLGAGDDRFTLTHEFGAVTVTLGAGRDVVDYRFAGMTITDFQAGIGGDAIDLNYIIYRILGLPSGSNPFATGHVRLVQSGSDTLVIIDDDGIGGGSFNGGLTNAAAIAIRLQNVMVSDLVASNFLGLDPLGTAVANPTSNGTAAADTLTGGGGSDTINGLDGDDRIDGAAGGDILSGGAGNDIVEGGFGTDQIHGGDGNDVLTDTGDGSDLLTGGDGDDQISVTHGYLPVDETITIDAGAGMDRVRVAFSGGSGRSGRVVADLGSGNDMYTIGSYASGGTVLTLGTGQDTIVIPQLLVSEISVVNGLDLTVTDFATGNGGDRLDWTGFLLARTYDGGYSRRAIFDNAYVTGFVSDGRLNGFNPFAIGSARLVQSGADTLLQLATYPQNMPGYSTQAFTDFTTVMVFQNTLASSFTAYNLGFDPSYVTHAGTAGNDSVTGTAGRDIIDGQSGDDQLSGADGNDVIRGGDGTDTLNGGIGDDQLFGGFGTDTVNGGDGNDIVDGGSGFDIVDGGAGNDLISDYQGGDNLTGGAGDDVITVEVITAAAAGSGQSGNSIDAGDGNDTVRLSVDSYYNPTLPFYTINLGAGDDLFIGSTNQQSTGSVGTLTLGAGRDRVFAFNGTITDFQTGNAGDVYDITSTITAMTNILVSPNVTQLIVGGDPFALGFATLRQNGNNVELDLNFDGTGIFATSGAGVVTFQNTTVASFTAANFSGFNPAGRGALPTLITNSTTIATGQTLNIGDTLPSRNGGYAGITYDSADGAAQFVNNGTVNIVRNTPVGAVTGYFVPNAAGINAGAQSVFRNGATGRILVELNYAPVGGQPVIDASDASLRVYGYRNASNADVPFVNEGRFEVRSNTGTAYGIVGAGNALNSGMLIVNSGYDAIGFSNGQITNSGTMTITGDEFAIGVDRGALINQAGGVITVTTGASSPYASIGILVRGGGNSMPGQPPIQALTNAGTITADIAYYGIDDYQAPTGRDEVVGNSGTINGDIITGRGNDQVINSGTITGDIILGSDNDRYDGANGQLNGAVDGGSGNDVLVGGTTSEALFGGLGDDVIAAGAGDDFVEGGSGNDMLDGGAGLNTLSYIDSLFGITADLAAGTVTTSINTDYVRNFSEVFGSRGDDSIAGTSATEVLIGLAGNDALDGRAGDDILWGGRGVDILTGGSGKDRFLFENGDGADTIADFGGADVIEIYGYTGYQSLTQVGADVRITLSATDSLLVRNTTVAALTSQNLLFSSGGTGLVVPPRLDETVHIASNSVIAQGTVFDIRDTAPFIIRDVRQAESTAFAIDGALNLPGVTLWNGGTVRYQSTLFNVPVNGITISIEEAYNGRDHSFVNQSTGIVEITAINDEVFGINGILNVWNAGNIIVSSQQGAATGVNDAGAFAGTVFVNSGSITVTAGLRAVGVGHDPQTTAGAELTINSGIVNVTGGGGSAGYELHLAAHPAVVQPNMVNSGTITVMDNTAAVDSAGLLIQLSANSRIWNSGTITADYAVRTVSGNTNVDPSTYSLTFYNSGVLDGDVQMSLYHDTLINTNRIDGDVFLGNGDDLYDGRQGLLNGAIDGYDGDDRILAGTGNQRISGGFGDDLLSGGAGNDELTGGFGRDIFRYETGFGQDIITDFNTSGAHDYIDVRGYSAYQSIVQQGADTLITFAAGETLLLRGVSASAITPAMIRFGAAAIATNAIPAAPATPAAPTAPTGQNIGSIDPNITFLPIIGTPAADVLTGGIGPDDIRGLAGADVLDGGTGNDLLTGGLGNDRYIADSALDIVFENAGEGTDTVESSASYYLYANVENLILTGSANNFGVGNELANMLTGNGGENLLIAGAGNDTVNGGAARDAIFGEGGADILNGEAGIDYIVGGLGNDIIDGGADADEMYGQEGDDIMRGGTSFDTDIIVGGLGNDTLYGNSGLGDYDLLYGNEGNDIFYVDTPADLVFEQAGEGTDTVYADINGAGYYLYDNIENLVLLDDTPFGVGNALDNRLTGNGIGNYLLGGAGNDRLNGMGGNDVLFGEAGDDVFVFDQGTGGDVIGDFTQGQDRIDISSYGLTFAQLQTLFVQNGNVGAIQFANGDVVVLHNVTMSQLTAADFILTPVAEGPPKIAADVMDVAGAFSDDFAGYMLFDGAPYADSGLERWGQLHGGIFV